MKLGNGIEMKDLALFWIQVIYILFTYISDTLSVLGEIWLRSLKLQRLKNSISETAPKLDALTSFLYVWFLETIKQEKNNYLSFWCCRYRHFYSVICCFYFPFSCFSLYFQYPPLMMYHRSLFISKNGTIESLSYQVLTF